MSRIIGGEQTRRVRNGSRLGGILIELYAQHSNGATDYRRLASTNEAVDRSVGELHRDRFADDSFVYSALKELSDRLAAPIAVVESPIVHVHADEGISFRAIEATRVLHRVVECADAMLKAVRYTVA